jgi:hypothetical protein
MCGGEQNSPQPRCDDKMMPSMFGVREQVIARLEAGITAPIADELTRRVA